MIFYLYILGLLFIVIVVACLPIVSIIKIDWLMKILCMDKVTTVNLIVGFSPLIFSIIIAIFSFIVNLFKNKNELLRLENLKINKQINDYNHVMMKSIKRFNSLLNELDNILSIKEGLMPVAEFQYIIEVWQNGFHNDIIYSNDTKFRNIIRQKITEFISIYKCSNKYDATLELLGNINIVFDEKEFLDNEDSIFIYNLRNFIELDKRDKNLLGLYCDNFGNGRDNKRIINEFNYELDLYKREFETIIRNKKIDDAYLSSLIYSIFLKFFYLIEISLVEIFFLNEFQSVLQFNYEKYFIRCKMKFNFLNEFIKIEDVYDIDFIDKYINKEVLYNYYKIL